MAADRRLLTAADCIEGVRPVQVDSVLVKQTIEDGFVRSVRKPLYVELSPDGRRFAATLVRGDLARNGNWLEVISARLDSLESAQRVKTVARLFTHSYGTGARLLQGEAPPPTDSRVRWLDDGHLILLWGDAEQRTQLVQIDVVTGEVIYLTHHQTSLTPDSAIRNWGIDARTLIYSAQPAHARSERESQRMLQEGFSVTNAHAFGLLAAQWSESEDPYRSLAKEIWLQPRSGGPPRRLTPDPDMTDHFPSGMGVEFSPDGRQAVLLMQAPTIAESWWRYKEAAGAPQFHSFIMDARKGDDTYRAFIGQHFVVDIETAAVRALWDVPATGQNVTRYRWSADNRSILVGPTFLPSAQADDAGLRMQAVAEVDARTGAFRQLPVSTTSVANIVEENDLRWLGNDGAAIGHGEHRTYYKRNDGKWEVTTKDHLEDENFLPEPAAPVRVELRQDLNTPPAFYAVETATGRERLILDLNPPLRNAVRLGHVEQFDWKDRSGRSWIGELYHPIGYQRGRRYPLVIQTHGTQVLSRRFTLSGGQENSPGANAGVFVAQLLANRGIAVLQVEDKEPRRAGQGNLYIGAFDAAIDALNEKRLIDRSKIALTGYSFTGWVVEHTLTHSSFPYVAAIAADNIDLGYLQHTLWPIPSKEKFDSYGGLPYGEHLKSWILDAPAFNAEKVRTPLQLQVYDGGIAGLIAPWEMFSRLRELNKPVELYVMPHIDKGAHQPRNPAQSLAVMTRTLDWLEFWLTGREDPQPGKQKQYREWRRLRGDP